MIHPLWTHRAVAAAAPADDHDPHETRMLDRALRIIAADACRGLRVQHLADRVGVSRRSLAKWFPRMVGCSPHEAIQRALFDEVENLLLTTDLRLADIAARTGFRHPEYLTVAFTRRYGMSPRDWRRRVAAGPCRLEMRPPRKRATCPH